MAFGRKANSYDGSDSSGGNMEKIFIKTPAKGFGGGLVWDEGQRGAVRQIFIYHGDCICSIQTACDSDGLVSLLEKHGGEGDKFNIVNLGSKSLLCMSGFYGRHYDGSQWEHVVKSLTFETDDGNAYGPFGVEDGEPFSFELDGARFGGFHGRSCRRFLRAIGIYVETVATTYGGSDQLPALPSA